MIGFLRKKFGAIPLTVDIDPAWNITPALVGDLPAYRFMPHRTRGEGLFMAILRKPGEPGETRREALLSTAEKTEKRNFTRFLLLADRYHADRHTGSARADKASLVFSLPHTQGSLSKVLTILSFYDINLTKIQSMPIIGCEWEYRFYVDVSFADYTRYRQSIDAITPLTKDFKILGEYAAFNE